MAMLRTVFGTTQKMLYMRVSCELFLSFHTLIPLFPLCHALSPILLTTGCYRIERRKEVRQVEVEVEHKVKVDCPTTQNKP